MSCHNIGKKTNHQRKRFCKYTEELNQRHHRYWNFQPRRHIRPEYFFPIFLRSIQIRKDKRTYCQDQSNGDVTCYVSSSGEKRYQSHQIIYQYEEKCSQQIRSISLIVFSDATFYHIVVHHKHQCLNHTYSSFRSSLFYRVFFIPAYTTHHNDEQQRTVYKQPQHILRNGNIKRTNLFTGIISFYYLAVVCSTFGDIQSFVFSLFQSGRRKHMPSGAAFHNNRQWNTKLCLTQRHDMPFVCIANVTEHQFIHIEFFFTFL